MTTEMNWENVEIDHVKPIFDWMYLKKQKLEDFSIRVPLNFYVKKFVFRKELKLKSLLKIKLCGEITNFYIIDQEKPC